MCLPPRLATLVTPGRGRGVLGPVHVSSLPRWPYRCNSPLSDSSAPPGRPTSPPQALNFSYILSCDALTQPATTTERPPPPLTWPNSPAATHTHKPHSSPPPQHARCLVGSHSWQLTHHQHICTQHHRNPQCPAASQRPAPSTTHPPARVIINSNTDAVADP